jgi:hypothetical protein
MYEDLYHKLEDINEVQLNKYVMINYNYLNPNYNKNNCNIKEATFNKPSHCYEYLWNQITGFIRDIKDDLLYIEPITYANVWIYKLGDMITINKSNIIRLYHQAGWVELDNERVRRIATIKPVFNEPDIHHW